MRGEKSSIASPASSVPGSPPHARGKALVARGRCCTLGITPACAGKSPWRQVRNCPPRDHPRMRGEKNSCRRREGANLGSPPHARGKGPGTARIPVPPRITPACAGKRKPYFLRHPGGWDHPRMRGEKCVVEEGHPAIRGSPPHARGKEVWATELGSWPRITPACAGKRLKNSCYFKLFVS